MQAHHPTILDMSCIVLWPVWPPRTIKGNNDNDDNNNNNNNNNDNNHDNNHQWCFPFSMRIYLSVIAKDNKINVTMAFVYIISMLLEYSCNTLFTLLVIAVRTSAVVDYTTICVIFVITLQHQNSSLLRS